MKLELRTFPLKLLKYCESLNSFSSLEELYSSSGQASLSSFRSCYVILRPKLRLRYWELGSLSFSLQLGQFNDSFGAYCRLPYLTLGPLSMLSLLVRIFSYF